MWWILQYSFITWCRKGSLGNMKTLTPTLWFQVLHCYGLQWNPQMRTCKLWDLAKVSWLEVSWSQGWNSTHLYCTRTKWSVLIVQGVLISGSPHLGVTLQMSAIEELTTYFNRGKNSMLILHHQSGHLKQHKNMPIEVLCHCIQWDSLAFNDWLSWAALNNCHSRMCMVKLWVTIVLITPEAPWALLIKGNDARPYFPLTL